MIYFRVRNERSPRIKASPSEAFRKINSTNKGNSPPPSPFTPSPGTQRKGAKTFLRLKSSDKSTLMPTFDSILELKSSCLYSHFLSFSFSLYVLYVKILYFRETKRPTYKFDRFIRSLFYTVAKLEPVRICVSVFRSPSLFESTRVTAVPFWFSTRRFPVLPLTGFGYLEYHIINYE